MTDTPRLSPPPPCPVLPRSSRHLSRASSSHSSLSSFSSLFSCSPALRPPPPAPLSTSSSSSSSSILFSSSPLLHPAPPCVSRHQPHPNSKVPAGNESLDLAPGGTSLRGTPSPKRRTTVACIPPSRSRESKTRLGLGFWDAQQAHRAQCARIGLSKHRRVPSPAGPHVVGLRDGPLVGWSLRPAFWGRSGAHFTPRHSAGPKPPTDFRVSLQEYPRSPPCMSHNTKGAQYHRLPFPLARATHVDAGRHITPALALTLHRDDGERCPGPSSHHRKRKVFHARSSDEPG